MDLPELRFDRLWERLQEGFQANPLPPPQLQNVRWAAAAVRFGWITPDPEQELAHTGGILADRLRVLKLLTRDAPTDDAAVGSLGRYPVRGLLGEGGMAKVFRVFDPDLQREIALKIPTSEISGRWKREVQALARMDHPNIVEVFDIGQAGDVPYLTMELLEGGTLTAAWRDWDLRRKVGALRDVASAIVHAHSKGVIHRDLKPTNVLVAADGRIKVADFGLAAVAGATQLTRSQSVLGTPFYMAPEQVCGEAVTPAVDVYAIGVLLYEGLTGRIPFPGASEKEVYHRILFCDATPPRDINPEIPRDLEGICLKAMAKEAGRRYRTAAELEEDARRWLEGEPTL